MRGKEYDKEVVQLGEDSWFRKHDADDAKLDLRWTKGIFVDKNEKPDELLLLTS